MERIVGIALIIQYIIKGMRKKQQGIILPLENPFASKKYILRFIGSEARGRQDPHPIKIPGSETIHCGI